MEIFSQLPDGLSVRRAGPGDGISELGAAHFAAHEPMAKVMGVDSAALLCVTKGAVQASLQDGLSFVATAPSGDAVGFVVARALNRPVTLESEPDIKVQSIFTLIDALETIYHQRHAAFLEKSASVLMVGVKRSLGAQAAGIAFALLSQLKQAAIDAGYPHLVVTTTSQASHRYHPLFHASVIGETRYKTYDCPIMGGQPFATLPGSCKLAVAHYDSV